MNIYKRDCCFVSLVSAAGHTQYYTNTHVCFVFLVSAAGRLWAACATLCEGLRKDYKVNE